MELISCVHRRTYLSNCVSLFLMYFHTVVESLHYEILLTGILINWPIVLISLAAIKAPFNSSAGIVNKCLFIGVTLDFVYTKLQLTLWLLIIFIYATAQYAFSHASANMCSCTWFVEKDLYHRPILTSLKSCMLCFQMFQSVECIAVLFHPNLCYAFKILVSTISVQGWLKKSFLKDQICCW